VETVTCRQCGQEGDASLRACSFCGSPMPRRKTPAHPPAAAPAPPAPGGNAATGPAGDDDPFAGRATRATVRLGAGRQIVLQPGDQLILGRGPDSPVADICGDNISRVHAAICVRADGAYLRDRDSTNGTFLNGERLQPGRDYPLMTPAVVTLAANPPVRLDVDVTRS
jgi:pSer/pThr/pTyr-binding forkhead associated (FHA) protein